MKHSRVSNSVGLKIFISLAVALLLLTGASVSFAGDLVQRAQEALVEKGIDPGPVDNIWGPKTQRGVAEFQKRQGLPVTGRLDKATLNHLYAPSETYPNDVSDDEIAGDPTELAELKALEAVMKGQRKPKMKPAAEEKTSEKKAPEAALKPAEKPAPKKEPEAEAKPAEEPAVEEKPDVPAKTEEAPAEKKAPAAEEPTGEKPADEKAPAAVEKSAEQPVEKKEPAAEEKTAAKPAPAPVAETPEKPVESEAAPEPAAPPAKKAEPKAEAPAPTPKAAVSSPASATAKAGGQLPKDLKISGKYEEGAVSGGGSISGSVLFSGTVPPPILEDLNKGKNVEFCVTHPDTQEGNIRPRYKVTVNGGKLTETVVFIENIEKGKKWAEGVVNFDFKTCDIFPKVSIVRKTPKGMKEGLVQVTNQDPDILHNPHGYSVAGANRKTLFNKPLPSKGDIADVTKSFKRFKQKKDKHFFLQCDQHNFMEADARVVWNPYYSVSGANGAFKIDNVPAGTYWVTAWHPYAGQTSHEVTVAAGAEETIDFEIASN